MKSIKWIIVLGIFLTNLSCKKFVEIQPPVTSLVSTSVYATNSTAASAITGIFITMAGNSIGGSNYGISVLSGLSADELKLSANSADVILNHSYINDLKSTDGRIFWGELYNCIYQANSAIEGISASQGVTPSMSQQLIGEAKFIRAFCYFYLVNIYGDVPLVLTVDYKINATISRSSKDEVYQQIVSDLKDAQLLLTDNYLTPSGASTTSRVRPNKAAATSLLARVYLYQQNWSNAEAEATTVINDANYNLLTNLNSVFLATSKEAIWQLEKPNNGFNTADGGIFLTTYLNSGGPNGNYPITLQDSLALGFESGDLRKSNWTRNLTVGSNTYYYPFKYKLNQGTPTTEYPVVLRLSEQYLIRAEARAQQGNIAGAQADLNVIRNRAGLSNTSASTQAFLLSAIQKERQFELFTEYGHRWFDLKRTGTVDPVMTLFTPLKGGTWQTTAQLFPIPFTEIQSNPNLTQNPGYN
nr:RagB/SusD family nutrient uptake outer membrane protein [uncultured Sediminibacterium sp.]